MNLARGVMLGEQAQVRKRILVPPGLVDEHQGEVIGHCLVPGCGAKFFAGHEERWQRHVGDCARGHMDRIRAVLDKGPAFLHEDFDPEVSAHMRKVGKRMLGEGRMEVNPNERAGF